jgi:hypothetical protein
MFNMPYIKEELEKIQVRYSNYIKKKATIFLAVVVIPPPPPRPTEPHICVPSLFLPFSAGVLGAINM